MDFHLATPTGDVYLFSYDGLAVQVFAASGSMEQQDKAAQAFEVIEALPE